MAEEEMAKAEETAKVEKSAPKKAQPRKATPTATSTEAPAEGQPTSLSNEEYARRTATVEPSEPEPLRYDAETKRWYVGSSEVGYSTPSQARMASVRAVESETPTEAPPGE